MMLVIVLVRSKNYERSGNRETQVSRSIQIQRKKLGGMFNRPNVKQRGKGLEALCDGMIRNVMCLEYGQN